MQLLTNSRLAGFRRCRRMHYYSYEVRRRPKRVSEVIGFGSLFHTGLEAWWRWHETASSQGAALEAALEAMGERWDEVAELADLNPFDRVRAEELMRGYHFRWSYEMNGLEVLDVESQFEVPLVNPDTRRPSTLFRLSGKLDARARIRETGRVWIVEHKTTSGDITPGSPYWQRLQMDGQISTYLDGSHAMPFGAADGVLYDVAKRPGIRPSRATPDDKRSFTKAKACAYHKAQGRSAGLKVAEIPIPEGCPSCEQPRLHKGQREHDETPAEFRERIQDAIARDPNGFYQRGAVVRLASDLDEHRYDTWETAKELRERQLASRSLGAKAWPRNPGGCERYGHLCDYWDVCTGAADIYDDTRFRLSAKAHEELEAPQGGAPENDPKEEGNQP